MHILFVKSNDSYKPATASQICEAASAYIFSEANKHRPTLGNVADAKNLIVNQSGVSSEQFGAIFLDSRRRVIEIKILCTGTVDHVLAPTREAIRRALELDATGIILFHNHPSGVPTPSQGDLDMTREFVKALGLFNITLVDHLIVGGEKVASFSERGLL